MRILGIKFNIKFLAITLLSMSLIGLMQLNKLSQLNVRAISALISLAIFLISVNNLEEK